MKRYKIEYVNSFEDYGDDEGGGMGFEDCWEDADTIDEARARAATLSEQFQRAEVFDTSLSRDGGSIEVWEDGQLRS